MSALMKNGVRGTESGLVVLRDIVGRNTDIKKKDVSRDDVAKKSNSARLRVVSKNIADMEYE